MLLTTSFKLLLVLMNEIPKVISLSLTSSLSLSHSLYKRLLDCFPLLGGIVPIQSKSFFNVPCRGPIITSRYSLFSVGCHVGLL